MFEKKNKILVYIGIIIAIILVGFLIYKSRAETPPMVDETWPSQTIRLDKLNNILTTDRPIRTTESIQAENYLAESGNPGMTATSTYQLCTDFAGVSGICNSWCILQIENGLITGCNEI